MYEMHCVYNMCTFHIICVPYLNYEKLCIYTNTGAIIEGPSNVTYFPGLTPLPVELTCNVTGLAIWRVNGADYTLASLNNGALPGHTIYYNETNILVYSPVNNTEYICVSLTNGNETSSDPAYIIIVGECVICFMNISSSMLLTSIIIIQTTNVIYFIIRS